MGSDNNQMTGAFHGLDIIGAGLRAEMQRAEVIAVNLSHLNDVGNKYNKPYARRSVVFREVMDANEKSRLHGLPGGANLPVGVEVGGVYEDTRTPFKEVRNESHPMADENGFVLMSNVDMFRELVNMRAVQRSFQANLSALRIYRDMISASVQNMSR